IPGIGCNML
ncbi:unnamed protein product, partial [Allacma fusca]